MSLGLIISSHVGELKGGYRSNCSYSNGRGWTLMEFNIDEWEVEKASAKIKHGDWRERVCVLMALLFLLIEREDPLIFFFF